MRYWMMKCEPSVYAISDLERDVITSWEGVRNYQARNFMMEMNVGDHAFFYHSNATPPGVAGTMRIHRAATPDPFAWDPHHRYYDPKSTPDSPRWVSVSVAHQRTFSQLVSIERLRATPELASLIILKKGNRLSITPLTESEWQVIMALADASGTAHHVR